MGESVTKDDVVSAPDSSADETTGGIDWADPSVPVGDAPPMPKWSLALTASAWLVLIVFLVLMAVSRGPLTPV